jgi:hypothetical protein
MNENIPKKRNGNPKPKSRVPNMSVSPWISMRLFTRRIIPRIGIHARARLSKRDL